MKKTENAVSANSAVTSSNRSGNAENSTRLSTPRKINVTDATALNFGTAANFDGTNNNQLATTAFVQTAIKNLIGTASENLDTLYEWAEAINQDKNFATTMTNALACKQDLNSALTSISKLVTNADKMIFTNAPNSYVIQ